MSPTLLAPLKSAKRHLVRPMAAFGLVWLAACGGDPVEGHVVAVAGQVLVGGEPLREVRGTVSFIPDQDSQERRTAGSG